MKAIHSINYNWFYTPDGEGYMRNTVGEKGVIRIEARGGEYELSPLRYYIFYEDGSELVVFNPNTVLWKEIPDSMPCASIIDEIPF